MIISEKNLLFPSDIGNRRIYECLNKNNLLLGLCTEKFVGSDGYNVTYPFPQNKNVSTWSSTSEDSENLILGDLVNYKVFSQEELFFLLSYEEKKSLNFETLVSLRNDYKRCSFIVDDTIFTDILSGLALFSKSFKYSSLINTVRNKDLECIYEYKYMISIFDINTVFNNIYRSKFSGLCVSFEILNVHYINNNRKASIQGAYFLLTNNYEGIFYKDGKDNILELQPDFRYIYKSLTSRITNYNAERALFLSKCKENAENTNNKMGHAAKNKTSHAAKIGRSNVNIKHPSEDAVVTEDNVFTIPAKPFEVYEVYDDFLEELPEEEEEEGVVMKGIKAPKLSEAKPTWTTLFEVKTAPIEDAPVAKTKLEEYLQDSFRKSKISTKVDVYKAMYGAFSANTDTSYSSNNVMYSQNKATPKAEALYKKTEAYYKGDN